MHMISEMNRVLEPKGSFVLSTPNVINSANLLEITFGGHPYSWSVYTRRYGDRHNREWTPHEVRLLMEAGGFDLELLETVSFEKPSKLKKWLGLALCVPASITRRVSIEMRGQTLMSRSVKGGPIRDRFPSFLYEMYGGHQIELPSACTTHRLPGNGGTTR